MSSNDNHSRHIHSTTSLSPNQTTEDSDWTDETGGDDDMDYEPTTEEESDGGIHEFFEELIGRSEDDEGDGDGT